MGLSIYDERTPLAYAAQITVANTNAEVVVVPAQPTAFRIDALLCSNTDVISHAVSPRIQLVGGSGLDGAFNVAAGAGFGAVAVVDGVPLQAPVNIGAWIVPAGIPFAVSVGPNMGATATMFVLALGGYV